MNAAVEALRGAWLGFYKGFYHDKRKPSPECLASGTVEDEVSL